MDRIFPRVENIELFHCSSVAMRSSDWQAPPFKLLLHLEWILLGIALLSVLSPLSLSLRGLPGSRDLAARGPGFALALTFFSFCCVLLLGGMGWRLPLGSIQSRTAALGGWVGERRRGGGSIGSRSLLGQLGVGGDRVRYPWLLPLSYITVGFALSWLAVMAGGRGSMVFPPLLLIVVTRGCVLFPRKGRWLIAGTALASFVMMQYLAFERIKPFGIPLERLPRLPGARRLPEEILDNFRVRAMVNVTLLFALVLVFVLLLVGALLQEERSRQKLAQANQQLRRYSLRIEDQAALQERSRIAREIHDTVGHCLTAQSIQLENVALKLDSKSTTPDLSQAGQHLDNARRLGREALQNVRQAVARLRIHPLQGQTLDEAIKKLVQEFQGHSLISLKNSVALESSPSQDVAIVVYRILQEGLTNLTKHSDATAAELEVYQDSQGLHLRLSDNGNGFDPAQNTTGFGLQSMAERAAAVQGRFQLVSSPGQGCTLELDIPV